jgi:site-specific recombinase XerD
MLLNQFLKSIKADNTREAYELDVRRFLTWLDEQGLTVAELRPKRVAAYRTHLMQKYAANTVNRYLSGVRAYLSWLAQEEVVTEAVYQAATMTKGIKKESKLPRVLQDGEVLDIQRQQAIVDGKGEKQRIVFLDDDTTAALQQYLAARGLPRSGPVFVTRRGERVTDRWMQMTLASAAKAAGVAGEVHPHMFRHTFGTRVLDETGDIAAVGDLLGHADPRTTKIYTRTATKRLQRVYSQAFTRPAAETRENVLELAQPLVEAK